MVYATVSEVVRRLAPVTAGNDKVNTASPPSLTAAFGPATVTTCAAAALALMVTSAEVSAPNDTSPAPAPGIGGLMVKANDSSLSARLSFAATITTVPDIAPAAMDNTPSKRVAVANVVDAAVRKSGCITVFAGCSDSCICMFIAAIHRTPTLP